MKVRATAVHRSVSLPNCGRMPVFSRVSASPITELVGKVLGPKL